MMTQEAFDILDEMYGGLTPYCMLNYEGVYSWVCDYAGESFFAEESIVDID